MSASENVRGRLLLSVREACEELRCGRTTLYKLITEEGLRVVKLRGRTLISWRELERFRDQRERRAAPAVRLCGCAKP